MAPGNEPTSAAGANGDETDGAEVPIPWSWPWIRERPQTYGFIIVAVILLICVAKNVLQRRGSNATVQRAVELAMYIATIIGACHMVINAMEKPATELGEGTWPMIFGFFMLIAFSLPRIREALGVMWAGDGLATVQPTKTITSVTTQAAAGPAASSISAAAAMEKVDSDERGR